MSSCKFHPVLFLMISLLLNVQISKTENVSIPLGTQAELECVLNDLQVYGMKAAVIRDDDRSVVAVNEEFANDLRITVTINNSVKKSSNSHFYFRINKVKEIDKGCYSCYIIDSSMEPERMGCIDVLDSPMIESNSNEVTVNEGDGVTLFCKAKGRPQPEITWQRENHENIPKFGAVISTDGSILYLNKVTRSQRGAYFCIASNGVPPVVSRRILLHVYYAPEIFVSTTRIGAFAGQDIRLVCQCMASPSPYIYWLFNHTHITHSHKHSIDNEVWDDVVTSGLRLRPVGPRDFGHYYCFCNNSMGSQKTPIKLFNSGKFSYHFKIPNHKWESNKLQEDYKVNNDEFYGNEFPTTTDTAVVSIPVDNISTSSASYRRYLSVYCLFIVIMITSNENVNN